MDGLRFGDSVVVLELAIDNAVLASGDVMCHPVEVPYATMDNGTSTLMSVALIDYDDQGGDVDAVFFDRNPGAVGVPNAAITMTDGQAAMLAGHVTVNTYSDLGDQQIGTASSAGLTMHPINGTTLWMVLVARAASTYASGRMTVKLGLLRS